jgi:hypothetical protein
MNLRAAQLLIELHDVVIQLNHLNVEVLDEHLPDDMSVQDLEDIIGTLANDSGAYRLLDDIDESKDNN